MLGALGGAVVMLGVFVLWELRCDHPMLPLDFFRSRRFSAAIAAMGLVMFGLLGMFFLLTQWLQFSLGYSPLQTGVRVGPIALVLLVAAPVSSVLARIVGTKPVVFSGMALIAVGLGLLSRTTVHGTYLDALPLFAIIGLGTGLALAPSIESVLGSVPREEAGVGSATSDTALQLGGALGVAVLGTALNIRYQGRMTPLLAHQHIPDAIHNLILGSVGGALGRGPARRRAPRGRAGRRGPAVVRERHGSRPHGGFGGRRPGRLRRARPPTEPGPEPARGAPVEQHSARFGERQAARPDCSLILIGCFPTPSRSVGTRNTKTSLLSAGGVLGQRVQHGVDERLGLHRRRRSLLRKLELKGHQLRALEVCQRATPPGRLAHQLLGQECQGPLPHRGTRTSLFVVKGGDLLFAAMGEDIQPGPHWDRPTLAPQALGIVTGEKGFALGHKLAFLRSASIRPHLIDPCSQSLGTCCDPPGGKGRAECHTISHGAEEGPPTSSGDHALVTGDLPRRAPLAT